MATVNINGKDIQCTNESPNSVASELDVQMLKAGQTPANLEIQVKKRDAPMSEIDKEFVSIADRIMASSQYDLILERIQWYSREELEKFYWHSIVSFQKDQKETKYHLFYTSEETGSIRFKVYEDENGEDRAEFEAKIIFLSSKKVLQVRKSFSN